MSSTDSTPGDAVARALSRLSAAVVARDEAAFRASTGDRDGFGTTVDLIWTNLAVLGLTVFDWTATGRSGSLAPARSERLGPDAQLVETEISWALADDVAPARQLRWLTFVPGPSAGEMVLAATTDLPTGATDAARSTPLWLLEPVRRVTGTRSTVIGGISTDLDSWSAVLDRAATAVAARVPVALRSRWNARLVAELPSNQGLAEQVLGAAGGSRTGIAAVTYPESTEPGTAPLRIVVNPAAAAGLPVLGLDVLATHEATHVATRSPVSSGPLWLIEGYADWVAYERWPAAAGSALAPLLDAVATGRGPTRLPTDADFDAGSADLDLRYAAAWSACRYIARTHGAATLSSLYGAARQPGTELADAVHEVLDRSEADLVRAWRADLARQAQAR